MGSKKIVARPDRQAHQPMLERRFASKTAELLERLDPNLLHDIFHLAFAPGITARGAKNPRRIFLDQWLEAGGVASQHSGNEIRFRRVHESMTNFFRGSWRRADVPVRSIVRQPKRASFFFERCGSPPTILRIGMLPRRNFG